MLSAAVSARLLDRLVLFKRCVSFGGVASSAELPFYFSHASVDEETKVKHSVAEQVSKGLVRLSIGVEHYQDLIDDLSQGFEAAALAAASPSIAVDAAQHSAA